MDTSINLYHNDLDALIERAKNFLSIEFNEQKHGIEFYENNSLIAFLRVPLNNSISIDSITPNNNVIVYISIESDNAAICLVEGETIIYHTTFSAYMTRKKQGYSQIKHLNKKGKSRAGSRIRLAETEAFFENINQTLQTLFDEEDISRIAINCSKSLLPLLYNSKTICPFDKNDSRLYKIPVHITKSNYEGLSAAIKKLKAPIIFYDSSHESLISEIL